MDKIDVICPKCNANLSEDSSKKYTYCIHCGTQIFLGDGTQRSERINRTIDEARIKEAELGLEQLKYQAQQRDQDKKTAKIVVAGVLSVVAVCIIVVVVVLVMNANRKISAGTYTDYIGIKYQVVEEQFEEMGFENIKTIKLDDTLIFNKGEVESVTINGKSTFDSNDVFDKDTKVIIRYH